MALELRRVSVTEELKISSSFLRVSPDKGLLLARYSFSLEHHGNENSLQVCRSVPLEKVAGHLGS